MNKVNQYYDALLDLLKKDYMYKPGNNPPFNDEFIFTAQSGIEFVLSIFPLRELTFVVEYADFPGAIRPSYEDGDLFYIGNKSVDELYQEIKAEIERETK